MTTVTPYSEPPLGAVPRLAIPLIGDSIAVFHSRIFLSALSCAISVGIAVALGPPQLFKELSSSLPGCKKTKSAKPRIKKISQEKE